MQWFVWQFVRLMLRMNIHLTVVLVWCGCWLWCLYSPYFLFCFWCWSMLISKLTLVHSKCWQWCWWSTACCARFGQTEANCKCFSKGWSPFEKVNLRWCMFLSELWPAPAKSPLHLKVRRTLEHSWSCTSTSLNMQGTWKTMGHKQRKPASQKNQKYLSKIQSRHRRTSCSTYFWRPARHVMNSWSFSRFWSNRLGILSMSQWRYQTDFCRVGAENPWIAINDWRELSSELKIEVCMYVSM